MKFEKGNEYGKTSSRKGIPNKINFDLKQSIKLLIENNFDRLQDDLDGMKSTERVNAVLQLLKYAIPTLKSSEVTATVEQNNNELVQRLLEIPEDKFKEIYND